MEARPRASTPFALDRPSKPARLDKADTLRSDEEIAICQTKSSQLSDTRREQNQLPKLTHRSSRYEHVRHTDAARTSLAGCGLRNASISSWLCWFTDACMVWRHGISAFSIRSIHAYRTEPCCRGDPRSGLGEVTSSVSAASAHLPVGGPDQMPNPHPASLPQRHYGIYLGLKGAHTRGTHNKYGAYIYMLWFRHAAGALCIVPYSYKNPLTSR